MLSRWLLIPVIFCSISTRAQFDTSFAKQRIRICVDSMMLGFKTKNWDLFTRYTYPALVGSMGGAKEYSAYVGQQFNKVPDTCWKKYAAGKILQVVKADRDLQAVIELQSVLEWQGYRVSSTSYLIGESWDGGLYWTFFDSQGDADASREVNSHLSPALIIPKLKESQESLEKKKRNRP